MHNTIKNCNRVLLITFWIGVFIFAPIGATYGAIFGYRGSMSFGFVSFDIIFLLINMTLTLIGSLGGTFLMVALGTIPTAFLEQFLIGTSTNTHTMLINVSKYALAGSFLGTSIYLIAMRFGLPFYYVYLIPPISTVIFMLAHLIRVKPSSYLGL